MNVISRSQDQAYDPHEIKEINRYTEESRFWSYFQVFHQGFTFRLRLALGELNRTALDLNLTALFSVFLLFGLTYFGNSQL